MDLVEDELPEGDAGVPEEAENNEPAAEQEEEELELVDEIPLGSLPQTGTASPFLYQVMGIFFLMCGAIFAVFKKKLVKQSR